MMPAQFASGHAVQGLLTVLLLRDYSLLSVLGVKATSVSPLHQHS